MICGLSNCVDDRVHRCQRSRKTALQWLAANDTFHCTVFRETSRHRCPRWMQWGPYDGPLKMQPQALPSEWPLGVLCLKALPSELAKVGWMWQAWGWWWEMRLVEGLLLVGGFGGGTKSHPIPLLLLLLLPCFCAFFFNYIVWLFMRSAWALNPSNLFVGHYLVEGFSWAF